MIGPLATGTDRCVKRNMAKKIEGDRLRLVGGRPQLLVTDVSFFKPVDDFGSLFGVRPPFTQISGRRVESSNSNSTGNSFVSSITPITLARRYVDQVCGDLNLTFVEVIFSALTL